MHYYSFKIFPRFWLVTTKRKTNHNQLLFTKFGKNFVILNQWRQKCSPLQFATSFPGSSLYLENVPVLSRGREKTAGTMLCSLLNCWPRKPGGEVRRKTERNGKTPLRTGKYFEWIIKQLMNSAFVWRIFQISEGVIHLGPRPLWITPSLICRILHI